jgi:hypothetical protein
MDALTFLKSLPAVLGVVGFFAYLWAGQYRIGGRAWLRSSALPRTWTSKITRHSRQLALNDSLNVTQPCAGLLTRKIASLFG